MKKRNFTLTRNTSLPGSIALRETLADSASDSSAGNSLLQQSGLLVTCLIFVYLLFGFSTQLNAQYCTLVCNDQVNLSLDGDCSSVITYDMLLENGEDPLSCLPNGPQAFKVIIQYPAGTNVYDPPSTVDESHVGNNLTVMVKHWATGNLCWGYVLVEDKFPPQVTCPADVTVSCAAGIPDPVLPSGSVSECSAYSVSHSDQVVDIDCTSSSLTSQIIRTFTVTDEYGNASVCTQTISILSATFADIVPPVNYDGVSAPALDCGDDTSPDVIPGPTINGYPIINGGPCEIVVTSTDQIIDLCGGSFKIIRTFTLADWCSSNVTTMHQVIKVEDDVPPTITCQADFNSGTNNTTCDGTLVLPPANASDFCSPPVTVVMETPFGTINSNGGVLNNAPLGTHIITYIATDQCGNSATCSLEVTVGDDSGPIAICDEHTVVSLADNTNGVTQICAPVLDDGSFDNCGDITMLIRRMDAPAGAGFTDCIDLDCSDLGGPVMVQFRVYDAVGNYNECMVEVEVQDKIDPTIICPPDKTLECNGDYLDITVTGSAIGDDNCSATVTYEDTFTSIDNCGEGLVRRVWSVVDGSGNTNVCTQIIILQNSSAFSGSDINWPANSSNFDCTTVDNLDPEDLPAPYSQPTFSEDACDMVAFTYEETVFDNQAPACIKIIREWTVIDWCQYNQNSVPPTGIWTYTQVIEVMDNAAPVLTAPGNVDLASTEPGCNNASVSIPPATATDCTPNVIITNDSPYSNGGADASGVYPYGTTVVTFTATDGCNNFSSATITVTVTDGKAPSPIAIDGLAITLMDLTPNVSTDANGMAELWASDFESGSSFDNCTALENLVLRIRQVPADGSASTTPPSTSSVSFDCDDLGYQEVELWARDEAGNWDYVIATVHIQDNSGVCNFDPVAELADIGGYLQTESNNMIGGATVDISGTEMSSVLTQSDGIYGFSGVAYNQNYTITPEKNTDATNGVTTFDLILLQKHILGLVPLNSPYKIIAADINRSGSISTLDGVQLRRLILNIYSDFPNNTSWRFIDKDFAFPNPQNPFQTFFPENFSINDLDQNEMEADFIGVKIGDLNGSAVPNSLLNAEERNLNGNLIFTADDQELAAGQAYKLAIKAKDFQDVKGFQFTLTFDNDKLEFTDVLPGELDMDVNNFGLTAIGEGNITTSWHDLEGVSLKEDAVLFEIAFTAKEKVNLSSVIQINSGVTNAEAYVNNDDSVSGVMLEFNTSKSHQQSLVFELHQNQPNPFSAVTNIVFELPENGNATLRVTDINGKTLLQKTAFFEQGRHEFSLDKSVFQTKGIYFYHLETAGRTATKKMLFVD